MKLMQRVAEVAGRRRLARNTLYAYSAWIRDFLRFCREGDRWRTPAEIGAADVNAFLTHLAVQRRLSASSQNQAINAIVFLYKQVLADELSGDHLGRFLFERSKRRPRVPTVLSVSEVRRVGVLAHRLSWRKTWASTPTIRTRSFPAGCGLGRHRPPRRSRNLSRSRNRR